MGSSTRDRLVRAAFDLFAERGFEQTTVDEIAARAGAGRTTYFRHFATKEAVVLPDHDALLAAVKARLASGQPATATVALHEAARLVLRYYLDEGDVARRRYRLIRTVPALRDAEMAGQRQYQRLFRDQVNAWMAEGQDGSDLRAELIANAVVTAHNHVLRSWLRGTAEDPQSELADAITSVVPRLWGEETDRSQVVVLRTSRDLDRLLPELQRLLAE